MKKFVRICLISLILLTTFPAVFCGTYVTLNYIKFQSIPLNAEALRSSTLAIEVYSSENKLMKEDSQFDVCQLSKLQEHTKKAFLSIEDKDFYKHNGINKKRIASAMLKNIKTRSLKEGASTISQQLIKNTHLSGEKTFERKLKEMALTRKLEKNFSKDEILESYLNIIFFGNNCYGLENASNYYFNKEAKALTLAESCTLAGMIKSPNKYSPIHNPDNCLKRRNLVLSEMQKDGHITDTEKLQAQNEPLKLDIQPKGTSKLNSYTQSSIDEAAKILGIPAKQVAVGGYKIHTYCNEDKQNALKKAVENGLVENADTAAIIIDAQTFGVSAYVGNSNFKLMDCKRQPASCLKPILVYAPALNENTISPSTQILDEKITIGGYSPSNVNKKYSGYMSVTDAVKNSVNIPAIKVLSYIGIDTGKQYASKLGIQFDEQDDSYALALGGMTYGVNLKDLASAYTVFPNGGQFAKSTFVQYITDRDNKLVYVHKPQPQMVLREDSAYLMTNILQETAKSGTSRKLSTLKNTQIASKTGTVGKKNASGNTDAYNISFTPTEVIGVWQGNLSNQTLKLAGGNQPTEIAKNYLQTQTYEKTEFDIPSSVTEAKVDALELEENHRLILASPYAPERYTTNALFSRFNLPQETSTNFQEEPEIIADAKVENNHIILTLSPQKHLEYQIFKDEIPYHSIKEKSIPMTLRIAFPEDETTLKITATYANQSDLESSKSFTLKHTKTVQKPKEKWYI
ncbi:MAG: transglycosylase domain-containing protein [Clostridia bacterium]|nr:transglycosylase domain-containing protein [Clostridia bacterium]